MKGMNVGFKRQISCITPCLDKHKLEKTDKKTGCSKEKGRCRCICPRHYVHSVLCRSTKRACRNNLVAARDDRDVTHLLKKLRASLLQSTNTIVLRLQSPGPDRVIWVLVQRGVLGTGICPSLTQREAGGAGIRVSWGNTAGGVQGSAGRQRRIIFSHLEQTRLCSKISIFCFCEIFSVAVVGKSGSLAQLQSWEKEGSPPD